MRRDAALALLLAASALAARAQLASADADWQESQAPPPPALQVDKLVPLEITGSVLRWGVDPASITIGSDGIVRYVVIARSQSGAVNAMYEGLRCGKGEVKVYARHAGGQWSPVADAQWRTIFGNGAHRHTLAIARNGACMGEGPNRSAEQVARDLGAGGDLRFRTEIR